MIVRVRPERFPPETLKKFHARHISPYRVLRRFGFNAYELEIFRELGINPIFNVNDLTPYCIPVDYLDVIPDPPSSISAGAQPFSVHPPPIPRMLGFCLVFKNR